MKIAYIIEVMHNSGGMERVLSVCANSLYQDLDVSIVTLYQKGRPTYFPLDNRIHCYDLGLEGVANRTWARPNPTVLQKVKAQLIGTPIISTNAGGIPSLIENGETGFLYPYSEPHALAFKIMNLAGNKEELEKVSNNEYRVSHNRHNPENIARQIIQIYSQIIKDLKF